MRLVTLSNVYSAPWLWHTPIDGMGGGDSRNYSIPSVALVLSSGSSTLRHSIREIVSGNYGTPIVAPPSSPGNEAQTHI